MDMLFPGQGTLRPGAGYDLYRAYPAVRACVDLAASLSGQPLDELIARGPAERLAATDVAQVAVVALSLGLLEHLRDHGVEVSLAMGHSAGEFGALVAAGVVDLCTGLEMVVARGRAMAGACRLRAGAMAAVTGLQTADVEAMCHSARGLGVVVVAAHNSPVQAVVSGDVAAVEAVATAARRAGALRVDRLTVGGAFHSPLMEPARRAVESLVAGVPMRAPRCTLVSSVTGDVVVDVAAYRAQLARQLLTPVRWTEAMAAARRLGAGRFVELGPGRVLGALARRCDPAAEVASIADVQRCERFLAGRGTAARVAAAV